MTDSENPIDDAIAVAKEVQSTLSPVPESEPAFIMSEKNPDYDIRFMFLDGESKNLPCKIPDCSDSKRLYHVIDCPLGTECLCPRSTTKSGKSKQIHKETCPKRAKQCKCKPLGPLHTHHTYVLLSAAYRSYGTERLHPAELFDLRSPNSETTEDCRLKAETMFGKPIVSYNIVNENGLPTEDCLNFILKHATNQEGNPDKICVAFRVNYDVTKIFQPPPTVPLFVVDKKTGLKEWTKEGKILQSIFGELKRWTTDTDMQTDGSDFRYIGSYQENNIGVSYIPNKKLILQFNKKQRISVDDVWGFFQGSFEKALADWGKGEPIIGTDKYTVTFGIPEKIHYGKLHRSEFEHWGIEDLIEYNNLELEYGLYLMERFQDKLNECDIQLAYWKPATKRSPRRLKYSYHGAGAIGGFFLDKWKAKDYHFSVKYRGISGLATSSYEPLDYWVYVEKRRRNKGKHSCSTKTCPCHSARKNEAAQKDLKEHESCKCRCHYKVLTCKYCTDPDHPTRHLEPDKKPLDDCPHLDHLMSYKLAVMRREAYYGARIELLKRGKFPHQHDDAWKKNSDLEFDFCITCAEQGRGRQYHHTHSIWHADIVSAYPTAMLSSPALI